MNCRTVLALFASALLVLASACGSDRTPSDPTPTPGTPDPAVSFANPPRAFLVSSSGETAGGLGTRSLNSAYVDYFWPVSNPIPAVIHAGVPIVLRFGADPPSLLRVAWYAAPAPPSPANGQLDWHELNGATSLSDGLTPPGAGDFVASVFANWNGGWSVTYGFYVTVR